MRIDESGLEARLRVFRKRRVDNDGQRRKSTIADAFDHCQRQRSGGVRGWEKANPKQVVEWFCH